MMLVIRGFYPDTVFVNTGDSLMQPLCLLTTSMDKTMIIWKPDPESGMWTEHVSFNIQS